MASVSSKARGVDRAGAKGARKGRSTDELARERAAEARPAVKVSIGGKPAAVLEVEADAERAVDMAWTRLRARPKATDADMDLMIRAQRLARGQWVYREAKKRASKGVKADAAIGDVEPATAEVDDD